MKPNFQHFIDAEMILYNLTEIRYNLCSDWIIAYKSLQFLYKFFSYIGETIEAKNYADVTMLFSDIVGFTAICSTATPMMVINMLQNLYEQFDLYCGQLDVYKVSSTISLDHWYFDIRSENQSFHCKYRRKHYSQIFISGYHLRDLLREIYVFT